MSYPSHLGSGARVTGARTPGLTDPVRNPEAATNTQRTKRAFLLILLSFFMPGAAQIAAGNKKLGRKALVITFATWLLAIIAIVLALVNREMLISLVTNRFLIFVWIALLIFLAVFWVVMFLNTLRLLQVRLLAPGLRVVTVLMVLVLTIVPAAGLGYGAYLLNVTRGTISEIFDARPAIDPVEGRYNFLLMGGDAGEDRSGRRPDSIAVFSVDAKTGQATTISIPRNLQNAPFPDDSPLKSVYPEGYNCGDECIINSLYTEVTNNYANLYPDAKDPGAQAMVDAAEGVLGMKIQAYVIIDMAGFEQMVNALGGITVNVGNWVPIEYYDIPGTTQKYPPKEWIAPGTQKLDGRQALWFARSRYLSNDYERILRQQCVQQAIIKQINPQTILTKFEEIANAGTQVIETDIPQDQLGSFTSLAMKSRDQPVIRLTVGPPDMGDDTFTTYPDFAYIQQRVDEVLNPPSPASDAGGGDQGSTDAGSGNGSAGDAGAGDAGAGSGDAGAGDAGAGSGSGDANSPRQTTLEELQYLAEIGDIATLTELVAGNGQCSPG